jgi:undecaprenyl-diphosphatase
MALILGIVEGLTEFLPVSSTAHIRLAQALLGIPAADNFWKLFAVAIQLPAVLAVVFYFFPQIVRFVASLFHEILAELRRPLPLVRRILNSVLLCFVHPVGLVAIGTVVTGIPAALAKKIIAKNLESLYVMGFALLVGGIVMWVVDAYFGKRERRILSDEQAAAAIGMPQNDAAMSNVDETTEVPPVVEYQVPPPAPLIVSKLEQMKIWQAVWIGAVQILSAVFPGTSRSMSTIAAGQVANLTLAAALEFSFFMSIPLMFAACFFDMKHSLKPGDPDYIGHHMTSKEWTVLGVGSVVSFLVAFAVIAWFMAWVRKRGFVPFAVYRIIIGIVVLVAASRGMFG